MTPPTQYARKIPCAMSLFGESRATSLWYACARLSFTLLTSLVPDMQPIRRTADATLPRARARDGLQRIGNQVMPAFAFSMFMPPFRFFSFTVFFRTFFFDFRRFLASLF